MEPRHPLFAEAPVRTWKQAGMLLFASATIAAQDLSQCTGIDDDDARLRCYDRISGREERAPTRDTGAKPDSGSGGKNSSSPTRPASLSPSAPTCPTTRWSRTSSPSTTNRIGENLINYNHRNSRIGIGVLMSDWL